MVCDTAYSDSHADNMLKYTLTHLLRYYVIILEDKNVLTALTLDCFCEKMSVQNIKSKLELKISGTVLHKYTGSLN